MTLEYMLVVFDELSGRRREFGHYPVASLEEGAARLASPSDYVVAMEDGEERPLNEREEAEFQEAYERRKKKTTRGPSSAPHN